VLKSLEKYKGIPPAAVIARELHRRRLSLIIFAQSLLEDPEQLQAVVDGSSTLFPELAVKIEQALGLESARLMQLQQFYDAAQEKRKATVGIRPDLSLLRPALFWDTDIQSIDWTMYDKGCYPAGVRTRKCYGKARDHPFLWFGQGKGGDGGAEPG
jgi:plasmid maintenance system antidote protein VapI